MAAHLELVGRVVRGATPFGGLKHPGRVLLVVEVDGVAIGRASPPMWVQIVVLTSVYPLALDLIVGDVVRVAGKLRVSRWTRLDGADRQSLRVLADELSMIYRRESTNDPYYQRELVEV